MSIDTRTREFLCGSAQRERDAYRVLDAMQHKYALTPEEIAAIGCARGVLNASARNTEWQVRAILKDMDQKVRP